LLKAWRYGKVNGEESECPREREVAQILSDYTDVLNEYGAEAPQELAFLRKYGGDPEVLRLLRGARGIKALFEAFGDFPDVGTSSGFKGE
jgi:hypothetical protein